MTDEWGHLPTDSLTPCYLIHYRNSYESSNLLIYLSVFTVVLVELFSLRPRKSRRGDDYSNTKSNTAQRR